MSYHVVKCAFVIDHTMTVEDPREFFGKMNSIISSYSTSVIRVNRDQQSLHHNTAAKDDDNDEISNHRIDIRISGRDLTCKREKGMDSNLIFQYQSRAQFSAIQGYTFEWPNIRFRPNEYIEFINDFRKFVLDDEEMIYRDEGSKSTVFVECHFREYVTRRDGREKICRIGDQSPDGYVIDTVRSESKIVLLTKLDDGSRTSQTWEQFGCDSDGSWDTMRYDDDDENEILRFEKIMATEGGSYVMTVSSPLCTTSSNEVVSSPSSLWRSILSNICFVGELNSRHFDFCPFYGRFGIAQIETGRPPAVVGHFTPPPTDHSLFFQIRNRKIFLPSVETDLNCVQHLPSLSERYTVGVAGIGSVRINGIGGPFNPMRFPKEIRGRAIYDPNNAFGCDSGTTVVDDSERKNFDWIAIVDRGSCMFYNKGLNLQKRGAKAVIVINPPKGGMIAALAGLPGKPPLDIPVILTDTDGAVLKTVYANNRELVIRSSPIEGQSLPSADEKINIKSEWYCDSRWSDDFSFAQSCTVDDQVTMYRDGEEAGHPAVITERLGGGLFMIRVHQTGMIHEVAGSKLYRDSVTPCTAELGTFIADVVRSDTCEVTVRLHSSLLCADRKIREPPKISTDFLCEFKTS